MDIEKLHRDIWSQPQAFLKSKDLVSAIPRLIKERVGNGNVILTGIATSLSALTGITYLLQQQGIDSAILINTSDLLDYWLLQSEDKRPVIVMSRSGESAEIVRLVHTISRDRTLIAVTENENSTLAHHSTLLLPFHADEEAFPNTISFTLSQLFSLGIGCGLGYSLSEPLDQLNDKLAECANNILSSGNSVAKEIGKLVAESTGIIIEGQGHLSGIVNQYALDLHETRSLGIPVTGGIMRHGVIELTERKDVMTLLLIPEDTATQRKLKLAEELYNTGKKVAVVTDSTKSLNSGIPCLRIPYIGKELEGIIFTIGMQLIYEQYVIESGRFNLSPKLVNKVTSEE